VPAIITRVDLVEQAGRELGERRRLFAISRNAR
jgi:hypothetical protein